MQSVVHFVFVGMMQALAQNEKVGFIIPTTRTRTFSMSARRFSEVGAVQFRHRVGIGILLGWLGV